MKTHEKIMEATYELCLEKGFANLSLSSIIKKANVGSGTIYYYFKDKDELVINTLDKYILQIFYQHLNKAQKTKGSTKNKFQVFFREMIGLNDKYEPYPKPDFYMDMTKYKKTLMLFAEGIQTYDVLNEYYKKFDRIYTESLESLIMEGKKSGELKFDLNIEDTITLVKSNIYGIFFLIMIQDEINIKNTVETNFRYLWNTIKA